jgi:hypothetical protein
MAIPAVFHLPDRCRRPVVNQLSLMYALSPSVLLRGPALPANNRMQVSRLTCILLNCASGLNLVGVSVVAEQDHLRRELAV